MDSQQPNLKDELNIFIKKYVGFVIIRRIMVKENGHFSEKISKFGSDHQRLVSFDQQFVAFQQNVLRQMTSNLNERFLVTHIKKCKLYKYEIYFSEDEYLEGKRNCIYRKHYKMKGYLSELSKVVRDKNMRQQLDMTLLCFDRFLDLY